MKRFFLAAALALSAVPALAQPPAANPLLQPVKRWVVDFSETHCTAARIYGSEEEPVLLGFRPSVTEDVVRLTVVRAGRNTAVRRSPVVVRFLDAEISTTGLRFPADDSTREVTWIHLGDPAIERLQLADELTIELGDQTRLRFALEELPAVVDLLRTCNRDLRGHWNVAGESRIEIDRAATPINPSNWLTDRDYPASAQNEGASGNVRFMLMVDETGAAKDCSVEGSSGHAFLDATACVRLLERARFRPARDAAGNPVRSVYRSRIVWRLH